MNQYIKGMARITEILQGQRSSFLPSPLARSGGYSGDVNTNDAPASELLDSILSGKSMVNVAGLHDLLTALVSCVQTQDRQITELREELDECLYRMDTANL